MNFNFMKLILDGFVLLFLTMFLGNLFGNIKFGKFNFGITGSLFIGLGIGYFLTKGLVGVEETSEFYTRSKEIISGKIANGQVMNLSLLIFIVGTGLLAAKDMGYALKKFGAKFIALAVIIPLAGALTSYVLSLALSDVSPFQLTGTYTGALTSSSGLAAAMDSAESESKEMAMNFNSQKESAKKKILNIINKSKEKEAELKGVKAPEKLTLENTTKLEESQVETFVSEAKAGVGVGHSIGYPFGVLFLILAMNFLPVIFRIDVDKQREIFEIEKRKDLASKKDEEEIEEAGLDFAAFSLTAFLGYLLGGIEISLGSLGSFSLGNVGGSIIVALLLGSIGKVGPLNFRMSSLVLGKMRNYFLSIYLAGTGLNYGFKSVNAITGDGLAIALVSIVVAVVAILVGFIIGHYVFKINWTLLSGAITGGMTSAPGLGAAIDAVGSNEPATSYGATQPLATLMMVIFSLILHQLPI